MKLIFSTFALLCANFIFSQSKKTDTIKQKDIQEVTITAKKPTVENKADRTIFNVSNSSILAGNTTWDVLRMTPLVSIDNNDVVKAEGENVTVYINDRKSVFTGKELKEYLKTIPADNLMKIEVITSPSAKYETNGEVINIVLKKLENEGLKGSATLTNTQNTKNSQYSNFNLNYHKKGFTETLSGSYGDNTSVMKNYNENLVFSENSTTKINTESTDSGRTPSFSSTSELEIDNKNNVGLIFEYSHTHRNTFANSLGNVFKDDVFQNYYTQDQNLTGFNRNLGTNVFYKYYDKEKNKILDFNLGINYDSQADTNDHIMNISTSAIPIGTRIIANNQNREYYFKADYSQPIGKKGSLEFGGKIDFRNNVMPYDYLDLTDNNWINDISRSNNFHYLDNINSLYTNFSQTFFEKLETRIGLRYEYTTYKVRQDVGNIERKKSYGTLLPDLLVKYSFSDNYNVTASYKHNLWRPFYTEFNPFLLPNDNGTFYRGNLDLQANPSDRFVLKLGIYKKYFISAAYWFTNHDYWDSYVIEGGKTIGQPTNFDGRVNKYSLYANTNQTFLKNKLNINLNLGINYSDSSDFNKKNNLDHLKDYITNFNASSNITYNNIYNKNLNLNIWLGIFTQNNGNTLGNKSNFFHSISLTKIFPSQEMEASIRLNNIFLKPNFDSTTYASTGTYRNSTIWDWHGFSLTFIKRFGNQKVKENTKTDLEKQSNGSK